ARNVGIDNAVYTMQTDRKMPMKYLAPEILTSNQFTKSTDVWAFACLAWEVFTLTGPYCWLSLDKFKQKCVAGKLKPLPFDGCFKIPSIPDSYNKFHALFLACQSRNP